MILGSDILGVIPLGSRSPDDVASNFYRTEVKSRAGIAVSTIAGGPIAGARKADEQLLEYREVYKTKTGTAISAIAIGPIAGSWKVTEAYVVTELPTSAGTVAAVVPFITASAQGKYIGLATGAVTLPGVVADVVGRTYFAGSAAVVLPTITVSGSGFIGYKWAPIGLFPSWVSDGTDITISLDDIEALNADQADPITGDSRQIYFALLHEWYNWVQNMPTNGRPQQMNMVAIVEDSYWSPGQIITQFTIEINVSAEGGIEVVAE